MNAEKLAELLEVKAAFYTERGDKSAAMAYRDAASWMLDELVETSTADMHAVYSAAFARGHRDALEGLSKPNKPRNQIIAEVFEHNDAERGMYGPVDVAGCLYSMVDIVAEALKNPRAKYTRHSLVNIAALALAGLEAIDIKEQS